MSTTTLKLPDELKARIAPLAEAQGVTPHAWMVGALATQAALAERRAALVRDALAAEAEVEAVGEVFAAEEVHRYLRERLAGKAAPRPRPVRR
jgi:predicted transcriptional regulator